jgi:hypothetical protein
MRMHNYLEEAARPFSLDVHPPPGTIAPWGAGAAAGQQSGGVGLALQGEQAAGGGAAHYIVPVATYASSGSESEDGPALGPALNATPQWGGGVTPQQWGGVALHNRRHGVAGGAATGLQLTSTVFTEAPSLGPAGQQPGGSGGAFATGHWLPVSSPGVHARSPRAASERHQQGLLGGGAIVTLAGASGLPHAAEALDGGGPAAPLLPRKRGLLPSAARLEDSPRAGGTAAATARAVPLRLRAGAYVALNIASTCGIVFANKCVLGVFGFGVPVALTLIHALFTSAGMELMCLAGLLPRKAAPARAVLPLAAAYVGSIVLSNASIHLNTVGAHARVNRDDPAVPLQRVCPPRKLSLLAITQPCDACCPTPCYSPAPPWPLLCGAPRSGFTRCARC